MNIQLFQDAEFSINKSSHAIKQKADLSVSDFKVHLKQWTKDELLKDLKESESLVAMKKSKHFLDYSETQKKAVFNRIQAIKEMLGLNLIK